VAGSAADDQDNLHL